jgi:hypothetical protein
MGVMLGQQEAAVATQEVTVSSLTSSGKTATVVTSSPSNITNGGALIIQGASQTNYDGSFVTATWTDASHFTYSCGATCGTSPATGTITVVCCPNSNGGGILLSTSEMGWIGEVNGVSYLMSEDDKAKMIEAFALAHISAIGLYNAGTWRSAITANFHANCGKNYIPSARNLLNINTFTVCPEDGVAYGLAIMNTYSVANGFAGGVTAGQLTTIANWANATWGKDVPGASGAHDFTTDAAVTYTYKKDQYPRAYNITN